MSPLGFFEIQALRKSDNSASPGCVLRDTRLIYDHYGIYAGKGDVIHFTDGIIQRTSLRNFTENQIIDVMQFDANCTKDIGLEKSLFRAESKIGHTGYDLINNNCEHFAIWCRTGKAISTQAFGSKSSFYAASVTGLITDLYKKEIGMDLSRKLLVSHISDRR